MQSIDALECCGHCPYYKDILRALNVLRQNISISTEWMHTKVADM